MKTQTRTTQTRSPVEESADTLVLIDFDGTITRRDTLAEFIKFYSGRRRYHTGLLLLAPVLALYLARLIPNARAKEILLTHYLRGENVNTFNQRCRQFASTVLPELIRPEARGGIEQYKRAGATIAVVSASAENWVKPWCDAEGLICLATKLQVEDGRITGRIEGRNCHGTEKVCRILDTFNLDTFHRIIAYGDSSGDREMLALAHEQHYKPWR